MDSQLFALHNGHVVGHVLEVDVGCAAKMKTNEYRIGLTRCQSCVHHFDHHYLPTTLNSAVSFSSGTLHVYVPASFSSGFGITSAFLL